ncbi:MAG: 50S ribosomal protein L6 [Polyangiaceae bacterium]|nr:50S ribosomal protein L6 [Polyangiaceae bacterium]
MSTAAPTESKTASKTSRVGKRPISLPKGVSATIKGQSIQVKGPKGELSRDFTNDISVKLDGTTLHIASSAPGRDAARMQGLFRALIASMVKGTAEGYTRELELRGTGYRVEQKGTTLHFALGFSHPVVFPLPKGISAAIPAESKGTQLILTGADKGLIGQTAATIRGFRPPEPYGGKGVRYKGEAVREKAGKAGKGGKK